MIPDYSCGLNATISVLKSRRGRQWRKGEAEGESGRNCDPEERPRERESAAGFEGGGRAVSLEMRGSL